MAESEQDKRLVALSALLQFEQQLRRAEDARALSYIAVNDSRRVVDFRQAFLWRVDEFDRVRVESVSNIAEIDPNAPAIQSLAGLAEWLYSDLDLSQVKTFSLSDCPDEQARNASEHLASCPVSVPLPSSSGEVKAGLVFSADASWTEGQLTLLDLLGDAVAHEWYQKEQGSRMGSIRAHFARTWRRYLIAIVIFFLIPIRQYVLAPAEVVPREPHVIAAPMTGVVDSVHVDPNDSVSEGQKLFQMEDTDLRNEYILARKSLEVARAEYKRNTQASFECEDCRGRVPELRAAMEKEQAAMEWANAQLERSTVSAPSDGTVVFTDKSDLEGKPVDTGQKIMTLSDPDRTRLKINLPVQDAIDLEEGAEVVFYPNVDPLASASATLQSISYEASETGEKTLAFPMYATFQGEDMPRLGLHGTAKLYGDRIPLIYLVLRKPLSWLRRTLGL